MENFTLNPPKIINGYEINDFGYAHPSSGLYCQYVTFEYQERNGYKLASHHFNLPPGEWKFSHKEGCILIFKKQDNYEHIPRTTNQTTRISASTGIYESRRTS